MVKKKQGSREGISHLIKETITGSDIKSISYSEFSTHNVGADKACVRLPTLVLEAEVSSAGSWEGKVGVKWRD